LAGTRYALCSRFGHASVLSREVEPLWRSAPEILAPTWTMRMTEYPSGVTCELVEARLEQYLASAVGWGEALAVAEHLEACASCAQRLVLLRLEIRGRRRGSGRS
jgi:hypothetical protein